MFYTEQQIREFLASEISDITFIFAKIGNCDGTLDAQEQQLEAKVAELRTVHNRPNIQMLVTCQPLDASLFMMKEEMVYAYIPNQVGRYTIAAHVGYFLNEMDRAFEILDSRMNDVSLVEYLQFHAPEKFAKIEKLADENMFTEDVIPQLQQTRRNIVRNLVSGHPSQASTSLSALLVNTETAIERFDICSACDKFNAETFLCNECGCEMTGKVNIKNESCPLKKWLPVVN